VSLPGGTAHTLCLHAFITRPAAAGAINEGKKTGVVGGGNSRRGMGPKHRTSQL